MLSSILHPSEEKKVKLSDDGSERQEKLHLSGDNSFEGALLFIDGKLGYYNFKNIGLSNDYINNANQQMHSNPSAKNNT